MSAASSSPLILYSYRGDFRACKGLIAAEFSGIQVERKDIEMGHENLTPEFLAQSPLGKVPILETSQGYLTESNTIASYIASLRRDCPLETKNVFEQAQVQNWMEFVSSNLELPVTLWIYPVLGYCEFATAVYKKAVQETYRCLKSMDSHLSKNTFFVGDQLTLADIVVMCTLLYPMKLVLGPEYRQDFPNLERWFINVADNPYVKKVVGTVTLCEEENLAKGNDHVEVALYS